uniref:CCHC-type domain-containing protein n=1 Tax=Peronospora matthiolae TaxID=2874970 RepID=A0AAV1TMW8_9STRA
MVAVQGGQDDSPASPGVTRPIVTQTAGGDIVVDTIMADDQQAVPVSSHGPDTVGASVDHGLNSSTPGGGDGASTRQTVVSQPRLPEGVKTTSSTPAVEHVPPQELFEALIESMKASPGPTNVDVWRLSIQDLFTAKYARIPVSVDALPAGRTRFPKLKGPEAKSLLDLFRRCYVSASVSFADWKRLAHQISKELLLTKWAFKEIIRKLVSQQKWATAPVPNQWAEVVRAGNTARQMDGENKGSITYEDFMFDPAKFSLEDSITLKAICVARLGNTGFQRLGEGSDDEWRIIVGIAEGHIVCRRMPDFLRSVLDSKERLRLYSTVQAQVEGQLVLHISGGRDIPLSRQTTKAITEKILESAELLRVSLPDLHRLLGSTKTISYNRSTRSILFLFFSRNKAKKLQDVQVPFQGRVYTLENAHQPVRGSLWLNQRGPDGRSGYPRSAYTIILYNLTRFDDIGRIAAYLRSKIQTEFELEDMDTCTPNSRTSTAWKVTFHLAGCPKFLQGIVRLLWFGTPIIIRHPDVGRRLQCLQCGTLGHPAGRCQFTEAQLRGPGGVEVIEADLQAVEDLAKPFSSPDEMRQMAMRRLQVQQSEDAAAQAAVTPVALTVAPSPSPVTEPPRTGIPLQQVYTPPGTHEGPPPPPPAPKCRPAQPWLTRPIRGGRRIWSPLQASKGDLKVSSGSYHVLQEDELDETETSSNSVDRDTHDLPRQASSKMTDRDASSKKGPPTLTPEDLARQTAAARRGQVSVVAGPTLLANKRRERSTCEQLIKQLSPGTSHAIPMEPMPHAEPMHVTELVQILGLREVATPATGNFFVWR